MFIPLQLLNQLGITELIYLMPLKIQGSFRVQSIYKGDKVAYITLKDKSDGSIVKVGVPMPLHKDVIDDGLVKLDGDLSSRLFGNNVSLNYNGVITATAS